MTFDEAGIALCEARNIALTCYGNLLLEDGLTVHDKEFATKMLKYAHALERWRAGAMKRIAAAVEAGMTDDKEQGMLH
jgi:hypothetical protein